MTLLDGPIYPAALARELDLSPSNVSNHLTCLRDCGIVVAEPEGRLAQDPLGQGTQLFENQQGHPSGDQVACRQGKATGCTQQESKQHTPAAEGFR